MTSITRKLPRTIESRYKAIRFAKNKKDSLPPAGNILSVATTTRLDNIVVSYEAAYNDLGLKQSTYSGNTPLKNVAKGRSKMFTSHFIQVFNLGVARGIYNAAHRALYKLEVGSDALPEMLTEEDIISWGNKIVTGDAQRITVGGAPMTNPTAPEVQTEVSAFVGLFTSQSNLKDTLDTAEETLETLFDETDKVIRKVWDEVETFYNEEEADSMRNNAREWGVIYITVGAESTISGKITGTVPPPGPGLPVAVANATILVLESDDLTLSDANGDYTLKTKFVGTTKIKVTADGYADYEVEIEIAEAQTITLNAVLTPL